jgi:hypothetical protein
MDTENPSVPLWARSRPTGEKHPNRRPPHHSTGGLIHDHTRHSERFTVIGNHLAQHPELSLLAIGLGAHIQSLPQGAQVDIKTLSKRFPEGATRIAAALRELETHGYLRRRRERVPGGRIVTRTVSCNQPGASPRQQAGAGEAGGAPCTAPAAEPKPPKKSPSRALAAVPQPDRPTPELLRVATGLLLDLRRHDRHLVLSAADVTHLAPGVVAWLERDVSPAGVRNALTRSLPPEGPCRPAALLAHRLAEQFPPPLPFRAPVVPLPPPPVRHPLVNCDNCDQAFRAPEPGLCRACRAERAAAAVPEESPVRPVRRPPRIDWTSHAAFLHRDRIPARGAVLRLAR